MADFNCRYWPICLRCRPPGALLLQTSGHLCLRHVLDSSILCHRRIYGLGYPTMGCSWSIPQPRSIQQEGACGSSPHGFSSIRICFVHRSFGRPKVVVWRISQSRRRHLYHSLISAYRLWNCWPNERDIALANQNVLSCKFAYHYDFGDPAQRQERD
jgi:hypothetical protein